MEIVLEDFRKMEEIVVPLRVGRPLLFINFSNLSKLQKPPAMFQTIKKPQY